MRLALGYLAALLTLCAGDFLWLGVVARPFVLKHLGALMLPQPNWLAAGIFYLVYPVALLVFAVPQADHGGIVRAVAFGALFGFFAYATYDLTNLATLKGWSASFAIVDVVWGTVLSAAATAAAAWARTLAG